MDSFCQLSQSERLDRILSSFEVDDCALGNCGLARKTSGRKLLRLCSDFAQIFFIYDSFELATRLVRGVQPSRTRQHGQIDSTGPARGCLSSDEMKLARDNMPARQNALS